MSFYSNSATLSREGSRLAYLQELAMRLMRLRETTTLGVFESFLSTTESTVMGRLQRELKVEDLTTNVFVIDGGDVCVACLEEMEEGNEAKAMGCFHTFHSNCISKWVRQKPTCPLCRFDREKYSINGGSMCKRRRIGH